MGAKIAEYRIRNDWSQPELAAQLQLLGCDLTGDMIGKIEIGYRKVSVFEIDCIVKVFGISYDELFAE